MKPTAKYYYVYTDYPEEINNLDCPDQISLLKLLYIKALFTMPRFITYFLDYEDEVPTSDRLRTDYIYNRFLSFFYDTLDEDLEEFKQYNTRGYEAILEFEQLFNITSEEYLSYDNYYDFINADIAQHALSVTNDITNGICEIVARHLLDVIETISNEPLIRLQYVKQSYLCENVIIHLKTSNSIGLAFDLSSIEVTREVQTPVNNNTIVISGDYPETYQGNNKYVQELFNCHLSEFLDYIQNFHNYTYPPDIFTESYFNKVTYLVWTFLNSVDLVQTYTNILIELFRDVFLSVYEPIHDFIKDGMFIIHSLTLAQGLFYAITIEKKLS